MPKLMHYIPMLTGEPLCDKQFVERLRLARKLMPKVVLEFYTNGSFLTKEVIREINAIPDVLINVSINGITHPMRQKLMGLGDFFQVMQSIRFMEEIKQPYRVTMVAYPELKPEEVKAFAEAGGIAIQYQSWAGQQYPYERKRWTQCVRALNYMTIRYTGDVCLCCFDPFGKVNFGNLNHQTIEEIWMSKRHRELVNLHKLGQGNKFEMCESCTEG